MRVLQDFYRTGDINLAALLHALGIPPKGKPVRVKAASGDYISFPIGPISQCGKITTDEVMAAWDNPQSFIAKNPESPISYIMAFIANISNLRQFVREESGELTIVEKGRSILMLDQNDPRHIQDKFLRKMKI